LPVFWANTEASGTAPAAALLALSFARLFTFQLAGSGNALLMLATALIYCFIGCWLTKLLVSKLEPVRQPLHTIILAVLTLVPLAIVYWPIYLTIGQDQTQHVNLIGLVAHTLDWRILLGYWIGLHLAIIGLFVGNVVNFDHPLLELAQRWRKPAMTVTLSALCTVIVLGNYPKLVCGPVAKLGSGRAAMCVATTTLGDERFWYGLAAERGQLQAIRWMLANTTDRTHQTYWLRKAARLGDGPSQFALYERLMRLGDTQAQAEAEDWLRRAAKNDHIPAQLALVDALTQTLKVSYWSQLLEDRNAWLERAAKLGAREAKRRLAQHYIDGSMGYPADFEQARKIYRALADGAESSPRHDSNHREQLFGLDATYYRARVAELNEWELGIRNHDPVIMKCFADRYLNSQLAGPGVRKRGLELLEEVARAGDTDARDTLIIMLRTGSDGIAPNLQRAQRWLIAAAQSGDLDGIERVAQNYARGGEGFPVDFAESWRWYQIAIETLSRSGGSDAHNRIESLRNDLGYIARLAEQAGGTLFGTEAMTELSRASDADSKFKYGTQLLAAHGPWRRPEAIEHLQSASQQGHPEAAWRLFQIYERGFPEEIDQQAALEQLHRAAANHHYNAVRELAMRYEYGHRGLPIDLQRAIDLYEKALAAARDNRHGWDLDRENPNHFDWLESRLKQARLKKAREPPRNATRWSDGGSSRPITRLRLTTSRRGTADPRRIIENTNPESSRDSRCSAWLSMPCCRHAHQAATNTRR
jgi:TPR repeat protein